MTNLDFVLQDLAWELQEEERKKLKHKKQSREHINTVIEMQDEELARLDDALLFILQ